MNGSKCNTLSLPHTHTQHTHGTTNTRHATAGLRQSAHLAAQPTGDGTAGLCAAPAAAHSSNSPACCNCLSAAAAAAATGDWLQQKAVADRELRVFVRNVDYDNMQLAHGVRIFVAEQYYPASSAPPVVVDQALQVR